MHGANMKIAQTPSCFKLIFPSTSGWSHVSLLSAVYHFWHSNTLHHIYKYFPIQLAFLPPCFHFTVDLVPFHFQLRLVNKFNRWKMNLHTQLLFFFFLLLLFSFLYLHHLFFLYLLPNPRVTSKTTFDFMLCNQMGLFFFNNFLPFPLSALIINSWPLSNFKYFFQ